MEPLTVGVCGYGLDIDAETYTPSVAEDLTMLKVGLLYGDRVRLSSLGVSSLLAGVPFKGRLQRFVSSSRKPWVRRVHARGRPYGKRDAVGYLGYLEALRRGCDVEDGMIREQPTKDISGALARGLEQQQEIRVAVTADWHGLDSLIPALESGLVDIDIFPVRTESLYNDEFRKAILRALNSPGVFPLFDSKLRSHVVPPSGGLDQQARSMRVAAEILSRLPTFDEASIEEILAIRRELEPSVARFRGCMLRFARELRTATWDKDFELDVDLLFRERVAPAVVDIDEEARSNSLVREIGRRFTSVSAPIIPSSTTGLGLLLSNLAGTSHLAGALAGLFAGSGSLLYGAIEDWRERTKKLRQNDLFFLHRSSQLLERVRNDPRKKREPDNTLMLQFRDIPDEAATDIIEERISAHEASVASLTLYVDEDGTSYSFDGEPTEETLVRVCAKDGELLYERTRDL